jgi:hypothetical protein
MLSGSNSAGTRKDVEERGLLPPLLRGVSACYLAAGEVAGGASSGSNSAGTRKDVEERGKDAEKQHARARDAEERARVRDAEEWARVRDSEERARVRDAEESAAHAADSELFRDDECCVCLAKKKHWLFVPCGHRCVCQACAHAIMETKKECPYCSRNILVCTC